MEKPFNKKVALITGGGSGIGRATSYAFSKKGAKVAVADIDRTAGEETVNIIKNAGGEAFFFQVDVSNPYEVRTMINNIVHEYKRIDFAFNNAGIESPITANTDGYPEDTWMNIISVNLTGVWICMKYEIPVMLKQGSGVIVNNASALGLVGFPTASPYSTAKHGVIGMTKTAALEYATVGIRINAVCPGFIKTPMLERKEITTNEIIYNKIKKRHPMNRFGQPEEIAEAVVWLCSDSASYVTGHSMVIDGGYTAQ